MALHTRTKRKTSKRLLFLPGKHMAFKNAHLISIHGDKQLETEQIFKQQKIVRIWSFRRLPQDNDQWNWSVISCSEHNW